MNLPVVAQLKSSRGEPLCDADGKEYLCLGILGSRIFEDAYWFVFGIVEELIDQTGFPVLFGYAGKAEELRTFSLSSLRELEIYLLTDHQRKQVPLPPGWKWSQKEKRLEDTEHGRVLPGKAPD